MPVWAWGVLGVLVASAVWAGARLARRRRSAEPTPWLGPLFRYELVRLTRRGAQPRLRGLYALLLFVGMLVTYLSVFSDYDPVVLLFDLHPKLPIKQSANFGAGFAAAYLYSQLIAVVLITPIYGGGAVTEEKDRRSLDYLQSSLLSNREIVLGKFVARMVFVSGVILAGLPILALTRFFGGVDEFILFGGFVITLMAQFSLGSFSLLLGVYKDGLKEVLYWSYGVVLVFVGLSVATCIPGVASISPFSAIGFLFAANSSNFGLNMGRAANLVVTLSFTVLFHGGIGFLCLYQATRRIRLIATEEMTVRMPKPRGDETKLPKKARPIPGAVAATVPTPVFIPPPVPPYKRMDKIPPPALDVGDDRPQTSPVARRPFRVPLLGERDPFLWKERYFSSRLPVLETGLVKTCSTLIAAMFLFVLAMVLVIGALAKLSQGKSTDDITLGVTRAYLVASVLTIAPIIGIRAAGSVVRERQRQTLLSLLTLPDARGRILRAKWFAPLHWVRYALISLPVVALFGLAIGGVHPFGVLVGLTYLTGFIPFVNSLGLYLSMTCASTTRAITLLVVILMALCLVPLFVAVVCEAFLPGAVPPLAAELVERTAYAFSPPVGVMKSFVGWDEFRGVEKLNSVTPSRRVLYGGAEVVAGTVAGWTYLAAAGVLYWLAYRRFEREGAG